MKSFSMTKTVMKNLFQGPATLMYPKKQRTFAPRARGRVEININECIFCGMCSRRCPTYALAVTKASKEWRIDRLLCCACNLCVEICPVKCLSMDNHYFKSVMKKSAGIYTAVKAAEEPGASPVEPEKN
jgi:ech hydrogenase subunit F